MASTHFTEVVIVIVPAKTQYPNWQRHNAPLSQRQIAIPHYQICPDGLSKHTKLSKLLYRD